MKNTLTPYVFGKSAIRTTTIGDQVWFSAADVCSALGVKNYRDSLAHLDDDEKGVVSTDTLGGRQIVSVVNESGLYALVLRSRKPEARKFAKWVTSEVLPAIRKTGGYKNSDDAGRCMEQAASIVSKIQMDLYKTLLSGRRGHYPRYLLSLDGHSTVVPVPHDAIVASIKDLPGMITDPGCISASKDDLTKVAHACLQVMANRLPSHT